MEIPRPEKNLEVTWNKNCERSSEFYTWRIKLVFSKILVARRKKQRNLSFPAKTSLNILWDLQTNGEISRKNSALQHFFASRIIKWIANAHLIRRNNSIHKHKACRLLCKSKIFFHYLHCLAFNSHSYSEKQENITGN